MFQTSEKFKEEIKKNARKISWQGVIILHDGKEIPFTEREIVKGSGHIHIACSGSHEIEMGSVYASEMGISLFSDIDRYALGKAKVRLSYILHFKDNTTEEIPMGIFDIVEANRKKKVIALKGYDFMLRFEKSFPIKETFGTAYELLTMICEKCHVEFGMTEEDLLSFPNGSEMLSIYQEHDIETYRDFLHYIAQTLGSFASIDRYGKLVLKPYGENPVSMITAKERYELTLSDFKTYYTAINSTNAKTAIAGYYAIEEDTGLTMNLGINPLMQLGLPEKRTKMCETLLGEITKITYTPFDAMTIGDPSLDVGDAIFLDVNGENIKSIITEIETIIGGKERIRGVGKNPILAQAKSKNDKNIIGLLNQIQSEHVVVHAYSNYSVMELGKEDTPIIRIEFASDKETEALFNACILLTVTCEQEENIKIGKSKEKVQEEVLQEDGKPFDPPKFEEKEVIREIEITETIDIPTRLIVTYVLNDTRVSHHVPKETYQSGEHILNLFYPLTKLQEKTMNNFTVLLRLESGLGKIERDGAIAAISGQSLGSTEAWDGRIIVDESWKKLYLSFNFLLSNLKDKVEVIQEKPTPTSFTENLKRFQYEGLRFGGMRDEITVELKEEETNA